MLFIESNFVVNDIRIEGHGYLEEQITLFVTYVIFSLLFRNGHPHLNNVFNGLLIWLAIFDNCFMVDRIVENFWRHFGLSWHYVFNMGYAFLLYPFKIFVMTCITNIQVALSIERFKAIR